MTHMNQERVKEIFLRPRMGRRLLALAGSITLIGASIAVFRMVGFGTDPCSTFTLGLSARTGISYGTCQVLFNLVLALIVLRKDLSKIGIGTVANMVGVGYIADFCVYLARPFLPEAGLTMAARVVLFAVSMVVLLISVAFYIIVDLGVAPYDAIPQLIAARTKRLSARTVRVLWDVSVLSVGFFLGSTVGLTTLFTGFCLGPVISAVAKRVETWFL